jgi:hypothetical protein
MTHKLTPEVTYSLCRQMRNGVTTTSVLEASGVATSKMWYIFVGNQYLGDMCDERKELEQRTTSL